MKLKIKVIRTTGSLCYFQDEQILRKYSNGKLHYYKNGVAHCDWDGIEMDGRLNNWFLDGKLFAHNGRNAKIKR